MAVVHAGGSAAVLVYLQQHVRRPLRTLRLDNYPPFAQLFTTALLQAAATGETLLDSDDPKSAKILQKLADKDASKIFRLNQRMQVLPQITSKYCVLTHAHTVVMILQPMQPDIHLHSCGSTSCLQQFCHAPFSVALVVLPAIRHHMLQDCSCVYARSD